MKPKPVSGTPSGSTPMDRAMQDISETMWNISQTSKAILEVQKQFNDNFILHCNDTKHQFETVGKGLASTEASVDNLKKDLNSLKKDFNDWFYPLFTKIVLGCLAIGGASVGLKIFGFW